MAEIPVKPCATGLIPMPPVADVQRSIDFYRLLGMEVRHTFTPPGRPLQWAHVACEQAEMMFTRASEPLIPGKPVMVFYLYSPNLVALRESLLAKGVHVSEITYPPYMSDGEICLNDPDGYTLLIGQAA
jgi:catechol 2,3-dioxygenase-like lactoylglutathione lyase family enzyme